MAEATQLIFVTIVTIVQVVGLSLNILIVFLNLKSLKNDPATNATTLIYLAMGVVNVFLQLQFMVQNFLSVFCPLWVFVGALALAFIAFNVTCMHCSFWLTGWLCAYYCITIVNSSHRLIVVLKRVISSFLPHILLLTVVGATVLSVPCIWMLEIIREIHLQSNGTLETSVTTEKLHMNPTYVVIAALLGSCLPFTMAVISTGVTAFALIRHIKAMKHNVSGDNRPNSQTLIDATRTMVLFLTTSIICCSFELVFFTSEKGSSYDSLTLTGWFILSCFPSTEAIIIIQASPKLRKAIIEKLCFWQGGNDGMCNNT
ncbi:taste receptor type 2 member 40-like [Hyperolius riggenbachi]|uniref:taste receptor type 2 member 40-like n=1 Tax=Hyperolius riggenbachi TaxID=752182 RepID=UPI0035A2D17E